VSCRALFLCSLWLVACAAPRAARAPAHEAAGAPAVENLASQAASAPEPTVAGGTADFERLLAVDEQLNAMLLASPDCGRACEHLASLCELAERICALAQEDEDADIGEQCTDGRARCKSARERAVAACSCKP
jgi:hypothetical protein